MTDLCRSSTLEHDPLQAYSGLSLFPRTLKSLSIPLPSRHFQSDNLQQTHTLLESMPFEVQKEHQEQAKAILDESSGFGTSVASQDMNEGVKMNPIPNRRERRPDLDSNRGHFVFKPKISAPPQNEPTFDVSKYPRPEDYFAAYDRYELAKGEWQKQTGSVVTDTHQNQPTRRPRRPGMPGMERGSFTHSFMKDDPADAINQEASEKKDPILSEQSLEMDTAAHVSTVGREVDESNVDTDKNVTSILAELLAYSPDKLEGDACAKILEERLRLKPINLEKFTLPELPDVRKMDLKTSGRKPSNRRSVLSDIQNLAKGINRDEARKKSQSPAKDQYSFPDNDNLLPGDQQTSEVDVAKDLNICSRSLGTKDAHNIINNASPSTVDTVHVASPSNGSVQKTSDENDSDTHSGIHKFNLSPAGKADNCVDDSITNRNSATLEVDADMHSKRNEEDVPMGEQGAIRNTGRRENDADINEETDRLESLAEYSSKEAASMGPLTVEKDSIPCQQDESSKSPKRAPEQYQTMDRSFEHAERQHGEENDNTDTACELEVENAQQEVDNSSPKQTKKRRKKGSRDSDGNMNKRSKTVHGESEGDKQMKTLSPESGAKKQTEGKSNERKEKKQMKTSTRESRVKKQTKEKSNESKEKKQMKTVTREGKVFARRKSLAGAGTKWESGVRRSTRIKSRPLEYWKGERLLFGRIHESLATLIGIKYESPGKSNGKEPALKVKSFVSDDYKELVDSVALH